MLSPVSADPGGAPTTAGGDTSRGRRLSRYAVLVVASVITLLSGTLVLGAWRNDHAISTNLGREVAEVEQVSFNRVIIQFETPDGIVHSPENGVLYPGGLNTGELIHVEYDRTDPDLVRVAGRNWTQTLLPLSGIVAVTWLVAGPVLWWLRSRVRVSDEGLRLSREE